MLRPRRFLSVLVAFTSLCVIVLQNARTQSALQRITNTTEEGISLGPTISGDGRVLAFESTKDIAQAGGPESFRAIRANAAVDPATFAQMAAARAPAPAVSQDGSRIVFAAMEDPLGTNGDFNSEIFLYEGAKLSQLTNTSPGDVSERAATGNFQPSISDDGRFIAFASNRNLTNQNGDANFEIFVYDSLAATFTQATNSVGTVGFSTPKISGDGATLTYIRDTGQTPTAKRDLVRQNRQTLFVLGLPAVNSPGLNLTYGRAVSDDGLRVVWSADTAPDTSQVFLFDGRNNLTRQITTLGARSTDVPLHPSISGDGSLISFATRRPALPGNSDNSVEVYTFDIPTGQFARVTSAPTAADGFDGSRRAVEIITSLSDDGSIVAFNFPRLLSGPVSNSNFGNNSEIYVTGTKPRPPFAALTVLNRASFGHELSSDKAVAPDSIAVALGSALAFTTQQASRQPDGTFPTTVGGTTVTVNGQPAQIFFVSPSEVHFHVPVATSLGNAEIVVTNADRFQSRGAVVTSRSAAGVFATSGDGLGDGMILNADTLQSGPFDPSNGNLRLIVFATGVRNYSSLSVFAGGRGLALESILSSTSMPGLDEIHVLVPADLRGTGNVDLVVRADSRDSNPVGITFTGDSSRDIVINEFLADAPGSLPTDLQGDANRDGVRNAADDEFVEILNTTTRDIDIGGYQLLTRGGTGSNDTVRHTFARGTILNSCTAVVIFGGGNVDPNNSAFGGSRVVKALSGGLSLINSAGAITLRDKTSGIANLVAYGGSTRLNADNNQSLTRSPDRTGNFTAHFSAVGSAGRAFSPGTELNGMPFAPCAPSIARVEVWPASASFDAGTTQQFTARAFDSANNEIAGVIFIWESSNPGVATIDQNGLATGLEPGVTEIRATARGVVSPPAMLTVNQAAPLLTSVTISPATVTIGVGETQTFTAQAINQFGQNIGGVTISFDSNNTTVATVDSVSPTSGTGSATAAVSGRGIGSAEIRASATNGTKTVTSTQTALTIEPGAGQLLISEFRTRGPAGAGDEFLEIYNPTTAPIPIGGLKLRSSNAIGAISDRVTITAGTTLGPGCHYLIANGSASGYTGSVPADQTYGTAITDDGGLAVTGSNGASIIDQVGLSPGSAYKEGTTLAPLTANVNQSYERKPGGVFGNGVDHTNNASDFGLSNPSNPHNSASACLDTSSADISIAKGDTPDPVTIGSNATFTLTLTNNGAADAHNVIVIDNLPADVAFVSCSANSGGVCGGAGNNRTITFTTLASGSSATIAIVATANGPAGTSIRNTATVSATTADANAANNSATSTTIVQAPLPRLSIDDVSTNETDSGTNAFGFTVTLSAPAPAGGATFDIATADGTAIAAGGDYVTKTLMAQTIPAGQKTYIFDVVVNGDTLVEPDENFVVNVTNVTGAAPVDSQGVGTISNDDAANLVISQIYAGGGNTGAQFTNDFVEIFNRGATAVNFAITPYSIQYAGATASFGSSKVELTSSTLAPGQYFLVQLSGGANGAPLPAPDATGLIAMAATAGKVALVAGTTPLSGSGCPIGLTVADAVGYGITADCFEGAGRAPAPANITADFRRAGGCTDTNNNLADFFVNAPWPRNTSAPFNGCIQGQAPGLSVSDVTLVEGNGGTSIATFTISLSAPAPWVDVTFDIATQNNTATTANGDYVAKTLTNQIIPAGQQASTFTVTINGDLAVEPDETFFVNATNVVGAAVVDGQGVGKIQNDDLPALTINDVSKNETDAGTTTFAFTVSLSAPASTGGVSFDVATQDGSATVADNDYVAQTLTSQTIAAGAQTYSFGVNINGDITVEDNETFVVNVANVSGATVSDGQAAGTIQNDDTPTLSIADVSANETDRGTTVFTFTVTSSVPAPAGGITFDIATADGTAQDDNPVSDDNDYVAKALMSQAIPATQTNYTFDVTVNGDLLVEANELFAVHLSNPTGATVADSQALGTILNDDAALVVISQLYGAGGNSGAALRNDFIEIYNRGATTVNLAGWTLQYSSAIGTSWQVTQLCPAGPCLLLPGRYFLVQGASGGTNGALLPPADALGTIAMAATAGKVALVSNVTALTGSACPLSANTVDFVGYGTPADCFEGLGRAPAPGAVLADVRKGGGCADTNDNAADFFINTPHPRNSSSPPNPCSGQATDLTIGDATVTEGDSGHVLATFTVNLHGTTGSTVSVDYAAADGTAVAPGDYQPISSGQLVFNPGDVTKTITVSVEGDTLDEPDETFFVNLFNPSNTAILDNRGRGIITDNDVAPNLAISDVSINEGNAGATTFIFKVHLATPALAGGVTFDIATTDGTAEDDTPATEDNDYVAQSLTAQTIPAGSQDYFFNVTVNGDANIEASETFFVNVANVSGAVVIDGQGQGTIQNDDSPTLSVSDVQVNEGNSGATTFTFTVTSSLPAPPGGITFDIATADGTAHDNTPATEDNDYVAKSLAGQTIPATQTTYAFEVTVNGDTLVERTETLFVNLANAVNAGVLDGQGQGTIQNDDVANLVITQIYPGGNNAGATYRNDFIEIFNRGTTTIDFSVTPYSVQYAGAAASFGGANTKTDLTSGLIAPGQYFLIQQAGGTTNGTVLPTPDASGNIAMASTGGKVALVLGTAPVAVATCPGDDAFPPTNPSGNNIVDFVGYGSGANTPNCFEGAGPAPFSTSTAGGLDPDARSASRTVSCADSNNNAADFGNPSTAPVARNTATPPAPCP